MDILLESIARVQSQAAQISHVFSYTWFFILPFMFYFLFKDFWMYHINNAYWATLDWVLLEMIPPKDVEKSPKPMENFFTGLAGAEKSFSIIEEYIQGAFPDSFSFELVGDSGEVHFYIRTQKKFRHMVEANLYAQYPDIIIKEVPDYVDNVPKIIPNAEWDMWGTDFEFSKPDVYPIKTYPHFEESITGKMIDPLSSLVEIMGKIPMNQKLWLQYIITPVSPTWGPKEGKKIVDKLTNKEKIEMNPFERAWHDIKEVFGNIIPGMSGNIEFKKLEKKEEQPLQFRLTPGEQDVLKEVQEHMGKPYFKTKMRFLLIGRKENIDKGFTGIFIGGIKQFNNENLNGFKPEGESKTKADYWYIKPRLKYKQRKIFRRYRNRSNDGKRFHMNTEELATVFHIPDMSVVAPSIQRVESKKGGAPSNLPIDL